MPFDPNEYLAKKAPKASGGGFDPDAYLAGKKEPTNDEIKAVHDAKLHPVESAISGLSQGLTFGYGDEIIGAGRAAIGKITGDATPFGDLYRGYRDEQRARVDQAKVDNPKSFIGGTIGGAVGTAVIPGAATLLPGKATIAAKAVSAVTPKLGGSFIGNVGRATAGGAIAGAGFSETDPTKSPKDAEAFGTDVAKGGLLGAVTQGAFSVIGKTANALRPSVLRETAAKKAVQAAGGMTKEMRDLGPEGVKALGTRLLQEKVVTAGASLEDIAQRAASSKESAGKAIGSALDTVDDLVATGKQLIDEGALFPGLPAAGKAKAKEMLDKQFQFNMARIGQRIQKELIEPNAGNPLLKGEMAKLAEIASDFVSAGSKTMRQGNVIKGTQGKVTNFNSETVPQAFKQELYTVIKTELDDVVAKTGNLEAGIAKALGLGGTPKGAVGARNTSASDAYQAAKKTYGAMAETEDMALKSLGRTQANKTISLTDTIAGVGGMAGGGPVGAIALGVGNKLIRRYGDSLAAVGATKAAEVLEKAPMLLGKFAGVLNTAAKNGSLPATHVELMKDPDYRRILDNIEKGGAMKRRLQGGVP